MSKPVCWFGRTYDAQTNCWVCSWGPPMPDEWIERLRGPHCLADVLYVLSLRDKAAKPEGSTDAQP